MVGFVLGTPSTLRLHILALAITLHKPTNQPEVKLRLFLDIFCTCVFPGHVCGLLNSPV